MARAHSFRYLLLAGAGLAALLLGRPTGALAQGTAPTLVWQHLWPTPVYSPFNFRVRDYVELVKFSQKRYALTGIHTFLDSAGTYRRNTSIVTLLNELGDTLRTVSIDSALSTYGVEAAQVQPGGVVCGTGRYVFDYRTFYALDTLGNLRWHYAYAPSPGYYIYDEENSGVGTGTRFATLPDGYLVVANQRTAQSANDQDAGLLRLARNGLERKRYLSQRLSFDVTRTLVTVPDGSYLAVGVGNRLAGPTTGYYAQDLRVLRFAASGDTIATYHLRKDGSHEDLFTLHPTPGGGYVTAGYWNPGGSEQGEITKLDAQLRVQWRFHKAGASAIGVYTNCAFYDVQPTQDGGYVAIGFILGPTSSQGAALLVGLDAAGNQVWEQRFPPTPPTGASLPGSAFTKWIYEPDGTATVLGSLGWRDSASNVSYKHWLVKFSGLALPWTPNFCATPPAAPRASVLQTSPLDWQYRADTTTSAGPRYAQASYYLWHWGDSSAADTGRVVTHRFLHGPPAAGQVQLCVLNNLFCQTCAPLTVLATAQPLPEAAAAAADTLSAFPNPTQGQPAHVSYRLPAGAPTPATLELRDLTGRLVYAAPLPAAAGTVALPTHRLPSGVYTYRLVTGTRVGPAQRLVVTTAP